MVYHSGCFRQERFRRWAGIALVTALAASSTAAAQLPQTSSASDSARRLVTVALSDAARDSLRVAIRSMVDSTALLSLTIGISVAGRIVWAEGFGHTDVARRVPATPNTLYSLASISKPLTATAVMRLVDRGSVRLDAPVNTYLRAGRITGLADSASSATVAHVLSHTAGLPLHYRFYYAGQDGRAGDGAPDVTRTINRYALVVYPPGTVYNYSNLGYGILGEVIVTASGTSYEAYMRDHVFGPLGMTRTTIGTGAGLTGAAVRYDAARRPIPFYDFDHRGASAVYSTTNDLLRFANFHLGVRRDIPPNFLADSSIRRMQQVATPPTGAPNGYGIGWSVTDDNGVRRVGHSGGMPGVSTSLALYPDAGVAIVALANQSSPLPARVVSDLAAAVMPAYANVRAARRTAADSASRQANAVSQRAAPGSFATPADARGTWRGTLRLYDRSIPMVVWIGESDVRVRLGEPPALWSLVNNATYQNSLLGGRFLGNIPTDDARRAPHVLAMSLRLHDGTLRGWLAAQVTAPTNNFSLSSYADLAKDSVAVAP